MQNYSQGHISQSANEVAILPRAIPSIESRFLTVSNKCLSGRQEKEFINQSFIHIHIIYNYTILTPEKA